MLPDLSQWARGQLDAFLSLFYPEVCQTCGLERATPPEGYVCRTCRGTVQALGPPCCERCGLPFEGELTTAFTCGFCRETPPAFLYARAAAAAKGILIDVIHRYKYQRRALWFEPFLAELLLEAAAPRLREENWDLIIPVPLHPHKLREREFNQAEHIARPLAKFLQLPIDSRSLIRILPTPSQTHLSREARAANMRGAFSVHKPQNIRNKRIIIVDDVFTTGATTNACAKALLKAEAAEVCVWTVARALLD